MRIRSARPADAAAVGELLHQLGYPQADTEATAARIQAWADDPSGEAYVADGGGDVLGVVAVHVAPFFERTGFWGRVVALVVSDRARRQGIARQLVAEAEAYARKRGCTRLEVTSNDRRQDAHEFYRNYGFTDQTGKSTRFLLDLTDRPA